MQIIRILSVSRPVPVMAEPFDPMRPWIADVIPGKENMAI
jgi:hypothetical protein